MTETVTTNTNAVQLMTPFWFTYPVVTYDSYPITYDITVFYDGYSITYPLTNYVIYPIVHIFVGLGYI